MTRRHEIETHLRSLRDIEEIMAAMKNLSLMETRRLARFLDSQRRTVGTIRAAAADFLGSYPHLAQPSRAACGIQVLVGAERGFCGDFNERLVEAFERHSAEVGMPDARLVAVGAKLANHLEGHPRLAASLDGPSVGQEIEAVLTRLVDILSRFAAERGPVSVQVFHHRHEEEDIRRTSVLPPFLELEKTSRYPYPPLLNVPVARFYEQLVDHYLFAVFHEIFYSSLMAEHFRRIQHLEAALKRLKDKAESLGKRRNVLRQEEITEEIEVIMLSTGAMSEF